MRGMLKTETADEALQVLLDADLAGAHNFLIFDRHGTGHNVEAMPSVRPVTTLEDAPIVHTNHTLDDAASRVQAEKRPSQMARTSMPSMTRSSSPQPVPPKTPRSRTW